MESPGFYVLGDSRYPQIHSSIIKTYDDSTKIGFGKHAGKTLGEVDDGYLRYLWNSGMNKETREDSHRGAIARYLRSALPDISKSHVMEKEGG